METVMEGASGRLQVGGQVRRLRLWFARARQRAEKARVERRAERDMARYHRAMAGMSDHMRRDIGLPPRFLHAHLVPFERWL